MDGIEVESSTSFCIIDIELDDDAQESANTRALGLSKPKSLSVGMIMIVVTCSPWWKTYHLLRHLIRASLSVSLVRLNQCFILLTLVTRRRFVHRNSIPELLNIEEWFCEEASKESKGSEEVGIASNVHRILVDWVLLCDFSTSG
ncbi:hypothetical protein Tco_1302987 [Tanacetum coccineum]